MDAKQIAVDIRDAMGSVVYDQMNTTINEDERRPMNELLGRLEALAAAFDQAHPVAFHNLSNSYAASYHPDDLPMWQRGLWIPAVMEAE